MNNANPPTTSARPNAGGLRVEGVVKRYGERAALAGLSVDAPRGSVLGVLGPNGAGKSTLVGVIFGLVHPEAGSVTWEGEPVAGCRARAGLAPQELSIYEELSGVENLRFFGRLFGLRGARLEARVDDALDFVGLRERGASRVAGWSGGMKRRLNVACAIVHDPELVVLDEPTVGVDPQSRNRILDNVKALRTAGKTVLYTTHYMEEAQRLCDRVAILEGGRLLDVDAPDALIARHGGPPRLHATFDDRTEEVETRDPVAELAGCKRRETCRASAWSSRTWRRCSWR